MINTSHIQVSIQGGINEGGERYYSKVRKFIEFEERIHTAIYILRFTLLFTSIIHPIPRINFPFHHETLVAEIELKSRLGQMNYLKTL